MKSFLKKLKYGAAALLVLGLFYLMNLFFMRPLFLDHFLAKELISDLIDSPEALTSIGLFDSLNVLTGHNSKLSLRTLEEQEADYQDTLDRLKVLKSYRTDGL